MRALRYAIVAMLCAGVTACAGDSAPPPARAQAMGEWAACPPLLEARAEIKAAVLDGRIYTGGGFDASGTDLSSFEMYDPAVGAWQQRAPIPLGLDHLGM